MLHVLLFPFQDLLFYIELKLSQNGLVGLLHLCSKLPKKSLILSCSLRSCWTHTIRTNSGGKIYSTQVTVSLENVPKPYLCLEKMRKHLRFWTPKPFGSTTQGKQKWIKDVLLYFAANKLDCLHLRVTRELSFTSINDNGSTTALRDDQTCFGYLWNVLNVLHYG